MVGEVEALMARQQGLISRAQALALGMGPDAVQSMVSRRRWVRVHHGVYRAASSPVTWDQQLFAAWLLGGPDSAVSHASAGHVWKLVGVPARELHVTVTGSIEASASRVTIHRSRNLPSADVVIVNGMRVTSLARTVIDLASMLEPDDLERALESATRARDGLIPWLARRLEATAHGRGGTLRLIRMVQDRIRNPSKDESALETEFRIRARRRGMIFTQQLRIYDRGKCFAKADFCHVRARVIVECNGAATHFGRKAFDADALRNARLAALGWHVIGVTWSNLMNNEEEVFANITRTIEARLAAQRAADTTAFFAQLGTAPEVSQLSLPLCITNVQEPPR